MSIHDITSMLWDGTKDTLWMVLASTAMGYVIGLPLLKFLKKYKQIFE